jgi:hypothetical protein
MRTLIKAVCLNLSIISAAAAQTSAAHQPAEVDSVLAVVDRFLGGISSSDLKAIESVSMMDGMTYQMRPADNGGWRITSRPLLYWAAPSRADGRAYRERYWQPTVLVRMGIATVWAPYEFWIDGKTSHCGVDVFNLVKAEGGWRVATALWTVEPNACAELRPRDPSTLRPR